MALSAIELKCTVRTYKSRLFQRFARKEGMSDAVLLDAVARAEKGQIDADLGGGVIKQRISRPGQGRSKGHRTIILFRRGTKAFFVYGFAKSQRANIDDAEKETVQGSREVRPGTGGEATREAGEERRFYGGEKRMSKKYRSDAMAAIHETMEALHDVGAIDKQTMRHFDAACLTPIRSLKPEEIKAIRETEHVSQTVFANYLNVTSSPVSKWERGEKRPSGASLKLLSLVERNGLATVA
jgi:putative transcriptional regulator